MDEVIEIGEQEDEVKDNNKAEEKTSDSKIVSQRYNKQGMTLGQKSDIGVCVTMICFVILSVLITATKIILIDMNSDRYADLFGYNATNAYFKYKNVNE